MYVYIASKTTHTCLDQLSHVYLNCSTYLYNTIHWGIYTNCEKISFLTELNVDIKQRKLKCMTILFIK